MQIQRKFIKIQTQIHFKDISNPSNILNISSIYHVYSVEQGYFNLYTRDDKYFSHNKKFVVNISNTII